LSKIITREKDARRSRNRAIWGCPQPLDVGDPAQHEQDVDRAVAEHLLGDVHAVGGRRVSGLGMVGHVRMMTDHP
jgi:hypothetical protein